MVVGANILTLLATGSTGSTGIDTLLQGAIGYGINQSGANSANVPIGFNNCQALNECAS